FNLFDSSSFCSLSSSLLLIYFFFFSFFFYCYVHPRALHSFPTRRSSDLGPSSAPDKSTANSPQRGLFISSRREGHRREEMKSPLDRKSTRLNSSHVSISYAVFCLKKKKKKKTK